jgi:hypothetical protein
MYFECTGKESVSDPDSKSKVLNMGADTITSLGLGLRLGLSVSIDTRFNLSVFKNGSW